MKKRVCTFVLALAAAALLFIGGRADAAGHCYYLSDMNTYEAGYDGVLRQKVGWGSYGRDKNPDGGQISVTVQGQGRVYFEKGIGAHAPADLIYDLGDGETYARFSGYFAVDASRGGNGWASIRVYASNDYTDWQNCLLDTGGMRGSTAVTETTLDITGYRYLRIVCDELGNNAADHTVVADARVYSLDYVPSDTDETVAHYSEYTAVLDNALDGGTNYAALLDSADTRQALMSRMLLEKFGEGENGYKNLVNGFLNGKKGQRHRALLEWLLSDPDALAELLSGGDPDSGTYAQALDTLSLLYEKHGVDLTAAQPLLGGTGDDPERVRGKVYRTMMFAVSLSGDVYSWLNNEKPIDPLERYEAFRRVYLETAYHLRYDIFENLCLEEMRYVMNIRVWNDELYWLNAYSRIKTNNVTTTASTYPNVYSPHRHLKYGKDWDYAGKGYLTQAGFDTYDEKYLLSAYGMSASSVPKLWMVFEGSHICWGISYVGTNFCAAFGVPSHYVLQPGHAAFFVMQRDTAGRITWSIDNNISGWAQTTLSSDTVGRGNSRMLCDWGTYAKGWVSYWNGSYILLSQYALDHPEEYTKAELLMSLASYCSSAQEKEALYTQVLDILPCHLDAWHDLITLYTDFRTAEDMADLADRLAGAMAYFPLPMHDLMTLLKQGITKAEEEPSASRSKATCMAQAVTAERNALTAGTKAVANGPSDQNQRDVAAYMANYLLGSGSETLAQFSFDGENAGKLAFGQSFSGVRYVYSLDGGANWSETCVTTPQELTHSLTDEELAALDPNADILIWLEGWPSEDENRPVAANAFCIDILAGSAVTGLEANDNEDRFFGNCTGLVWSEDGENWYPLTGEQVFSGAKTVLVHKTAAGRTMQGADVTFRFTDNHSDTRSYIPIRRLTLAGFSSEETSTGDNAAHAIDGMLSTRWHTLWKGGDTQRYLSIRTDSPTYFSGVDYTPVSGGGNGTFYSCAVYVSMDGVNWYPAAAASGWGNNGNVKHIDFATPVYGQYVKVVGTSTVGGFASARAVELFEDTTVAGKTIAGSVLQSLPTKTQYQQGELLDLTGISAQTVYTDGSRSAVPRTLLTADVTVLRHTGTQEVRISYLSRQVGSFTVEVTANTRTADTLTVETLPLKTDYYAGQALDLRGLTVRAADQAGVWYPTDYTVTPDGALETGTAAITVTYQSRSASFPVTVDKTPLRLEVTALPQKTTYCIGEDFAPSGLEVTLYFEDGTYRLLEAEGGEYTIDVGLFSALPGQKQLLLTLTGWEEFSTLLPVTVLSNLAQGEYLYDVLPSDTGEYRCYLAGYTGTDTTVSVPAQVIAGGVTYSVVGVRSGAFDSAPQVTTLALPGTIQHLEQGSLTALSALSELYLTGIGRMEDLTIDNGSLPDGAAGTIYMANAELTDGLDSVLTDYSGNPDVPLNLTSGNLLTSGQLEQLRLTPPVKTVYQLDETMEYSGMSLEALLKNGVVLPLGDHQYTVTGDSNGTYGARTVTLSVNGTQESAAFTVQVEETAPLILQHPLDQSWISETPVAQPLTVSVEGGQSGLHYQWYRSADSAFSIQEDSKVGDNAPSYTPTETGYYYVVVCRLDSCGQPGQSAQSLSAHVRLETFPVLNQSTGVGYATLPEAVAAAESGQSILLRRSLSLAAIVTINKTLTLAGESDSVVITRDAAFSGDLFRLSGGSLTVNDLIFHGENRTVAGSCFTLTGGAVLTLGEGVLIKNFRTTAGGAAVFLNDKDTAPVLNWNGATVQDCAAANFGGGVFVQAKGRITVTGGSFLRNSAGLLGGAICTNSRVADILTLSGGLFEGNSAPYGGAVLIGGPSASLISGGIFRDNRATVMGSQICYYNGGTHSVTGGSFTYSGTSGIAAKSDGSSYYSSISAGVTGGHFSTVPPYVASGYTALAQNGGYLVVQESTGLWIQSVQRQGDTLNITLRQSVTGTLIAASYDEGGRLVCTACVSLTAADSAAVTLPRAAVTVFYLTDSDNLPLYPAYWSRENVS